MFLGLITRMLSLFVLLAGWDMTKQSGWAFFLGVAIFVIGAEAFDSACIWNYNRRRMPYRWRCPVCRNQGKKVGMESSLEDVIQRFREDHNRTVHLMEP